MSLFHPRVINKRIEGKNVIPDEHNRILSAWIQSLKDGVFDRETSNDSEFIQRIMVEVLGYTGSSQGSHWTLQKNQPIASGNVDIALGSFSNEKESILAPFELKGAKTQDLDAIMPGRNKSPVQQAWEYAMDAKGAQWVLVSNYRVIRLYAVGYGRKDYELFNIEELLDPGQYARFILLLSAQNLLGGLSLELLKESESKEKEITKDFYKDYKDIRLRMINMLIKDNSEIDKDRIVECSQKILDRILFVAFSEDRGLLPKKTIKSCYDDRGKWNPQPAWSNFKALFNAIDRGNSDLKIPGYNGGLFAPDDVLDSLVVCDEICNGFKKISSHDFDSDVSVNILGHIFEQSISDIEDIKSSIEGSTVLYANGRDKRKTDGVFYTPSYVTHYIVENVLGDWLEDRKKEIGFDDLPELSEKDYQSVRVISRGKRKNVVVSNAKIKNHVKAWESYKEILCNIKILDPACGSGAFLNEVFDYLNKEGGVINNELTILYGNQAQLFRWDTHILSSNIYGVDINPESVEITKLSLWLKTANRGEKLTYLDDNIKCGNSLVNESLENNDRAFDWGKNFPGVISNGGFDIVLGNPPWGAEIPQKHLEQIKNNHQEIIVRMIDSYMFFLSQGLRVTKTGGYNGWVVPDSLLYQSGNQKLRELVVQQCQLKVLVNMGDVFEDVSRPCCIAVYKKSDAVPEGNICVADISSDTDKRKLFGSDVFVECPSNIYADLPDHIWATKNLNGYKILSKYKTCLKDCLDLDGIQRGVSPDLKEAFVVDETVCSSHFFESEYVKPTVTGGVDVKRYCIPTPGKRVLYIGRDVTEEMIPNIVNFVRKFKDKITCKEVSQGKHHFFALHRARKESIFSKDNKIIGVITSDRIITSVDTIGLYPTDGLYVMSAKDGISPHYITAVLNSSLATFFYRLLSGEVGRTLSQIKPTVLAKIPFLLISEKEQEKFIERVEFLHAKNFELYRMTAKIYGLLRADFGIDKLGRSLEKWYLMEFDSFVQELGNKGVNLTLNKRSEWFDYFEERKMAAYSLARDVDSVDNEVEQLVHNLYGLSIDDIGDSSIS